MTGTVTLYGISNCDTIKKARAWLSRHAVEYRFHDYRKQGLERGLLETFEKTLGWEQLLNRRGTSWRKLPQAQRDGIDRGAALQLMLDNPALIKRPLLEIAGSRYLGFSETAYAEIFDPA